MAIGYELFVGDTCIWLPREIDARGPITIHVLDGSMDVHADGDRTTLGAGMLMAPPRGTPHSATSDEGALFFLTVLK